MLQPDVSHRVYVSDTRPHVAACLKYARPRVWIHGHIYVFKLAAECFKRSAAYLVIRYIHDVQTVTVLLHTGKETNLVLISLRFVAEL